jgi:hypothetical protein
LRSGTQARSHLEHLILRFQIEQFDHQRAYERLGDRLVESDRQGAILIGKRSQLRRHERVSRGREHGLAQPRARAGSADLVAHKVEFDLDDLDHVAAQDRKLILVERLRVGSSLERVNACRRYLEAKESKICRLGSARARCGTSGGAAGAEQARSFDRCREGGSGAGDGAGVGGGRGNPPAKLPDIIVAARRRTGAIDAESGPTGSVESADEHCLGESRARRLEIARMSESVAPRGEQDENAARRGILDGGGDAHVPRERQRNVDRIHAKTSRPSDRHRYGRRIGLARQIRSRRAPSGSSIRNDAVPRFRFASRARIVATIVS